MARMNAPTADVSVRVGWADDALGIAEVQVHAWQQEYSGVLPPMDPTDVAAAWQASIRSQTAGTVRHSIWSRCRPAVFRLKGRGGA